MKSQFVKTVKALVNDESAQGATEYILLLVVVVGLMIAFKKQIVGVVSSKVDGVGKDISGFTAQ